MKKEMLRKQQRELLGEIAELLSAMELMVELSSKEENGLADAVIAEHPEVGDSHTELLGEYYFLPLEAEEMELQHFVTALTVLDDMEPDSSERMTEAIAKINYMLPEGAFQISPDGEILSYRYVSVMPADLPHEKMFIRMRKQIASALENTALWSDMLLSVDAGTVSFEEFMDFFRQRYHD